MEYQKESHHSKKTVDKCHMCYQSYVCKKCKELCIFSRVFFERANKDKKLRANLKDKYYKEDFDYMRNQISKPQEQEQEEQTQKTKKKKQKALKEETFSDDDVDETEYELLKRFRANTSEFPQIIEDHNLYESNGRTNLIHINGIVMGKSIMNGRCSWHRSASQGKYFKTSGFGNNKGAPRQSKNQDLLKDHEEFTVNDDDDN